jgi:hypothetical protein
MKQLTNRLYQLNLGAFNAFVLEDDGLALVDTGLPGSTAQLFAALRAAGKTRPTSSASFSPTCTPTIAATRPTSSARPTLACTPTTPMLSCWNKV